MGVETVVPPESGLVSVDGEVQVRKFLGTPAEENHIVQFYEDEGVLFDNVAHYLAAGLNANEVVIVVATDAHRKAFTARLQLLGCNVSEKTASGQLTMLDARATLAQFMVGSTPDWQKFRSAVGGVVEKSLRGGSVRVRAYGEMVDLLWRDGNQQAALSLEGFWNDLAREHSFSLLCAYVMGNFYKSGDRQKFEEVCRTHTHVIPTEQYSTSDDGRLREISALQQRARSLESEVEQRKVLEGALREALQREKSLREEAERTVRFNEMFAGMLGHDLRNPLNAITMGAHYIARSDEKSTKAASRIILSAERMSRMIDQLLDFTRIRVGTGIALNCTHLDLSELCFRVKDELEAANPDCAIDFEAKGDTAGEWDYDRLQQVFSNLVSNAIHHGDAGCRILLRTDGSDARNVVAVVQNRGVVPPEILPVLFEPFRGSKKLQKTQGLGLGLYITRQIVMAHGGTIEASSTEADGTTMRVTLPRAPARPNR